jgi:peptidoglycan hydrolase CwlO-like protein
MSDTKTLAQSFPAETWAALIACFTVICGLASILYNRLNLDIKAHDIQLENGRNAFENIGKMIVRLEEIVKKLSEKEDNYSDDLNEIRRELTHLKSDFHELEVDCAKQHGGKALN